jgi:two-component system OmpR family sensor kinase
LDRMAEQLQQLVTAQRRLLHDVSHELRSPLARLQAASGLLRQDPDRLDASLERIDREVGRVDTLVGEVLTLARLESATAGLPGDAVDLGEIVEIVAADARFEAQSAGRDVSCRVDRHALVHGSAELLHRAVENVVRNAVKHTDQGTTVEIELRALRDVPLAALTVSDRGPGVPPQQLERIFEPFYRGEAPNGGGFGLGMAIANRAVAAHGGSIKASDLAPHGLRVEILLPTIADSLDANSQSRNTA